MKLVGILGSRNPEGQTARAADALLQGAQDAGWVVSRTFLPTIEIESCRQCDDNGWGTCRSEGLCTIDDDLAAVVDQIREADAVMFATPVYWGDLSESMRAFTDRLRRITRHETGRAGITDKRAIGVCVAGGGGGGGPTCTVSLEKVLRTCGFDVVDLVPARRQNLGMKCDVLYITGKWLAEA
jgi:multimeric flavodoxin WrbA